MMNVLIVDGHPIFREFFEIFCSSQLRPTAVVSATDGAAAIQHLQSQPFTLLILDLHLPDLDGFTVADAALEIAPDIRIIVVTSRSDDYTIYRAEKRRIRGFLDKRAVTATALNTAIEKIFAGGVYFSPSLLRLRSERIRNSTSFDKILSDRELEVLALIAVPFSYREIATELGISPQTVEKHRFNVLRKLGLTTTTELARFARTCGIALHLPLIRRDAAVG